jgi:CRISPR-associated protein Cas1
VEAKISQQMLLLKKLNKEFKPMETYLSGVKSGDSTNMEGIAAQYYWKQMFNNFDRERKGASPNHLLNFGYAILRSIVARALVSSGLNPTLGIFHRNKYNAYCLADDIMEPYRPYVDAMVYELVEDRSAEDELTKEMKAYLLKITQKDVMILQKIRPLLVAVSSTTASLYKCYTGENRLIHYPTLC